MSKYLKFLTALALLALALAGAGCGPGESVGLGAETDDSGYREGQQLEKQGRPQEALVSYLKVISRRSEAAPESHLDAGLIYKQHLKNPIAAIYHFQKYLEQQPNSRQAPLVRQQIEAARLDFFRTLPNRPLDSREVRIDGFDQRDRLERENEQLKAELSVLRAGATGGATTAPRRLSTVENRDPRAVPAEEESSPITLAPLQQRETEPVAKVQTPQPGLGAGTRAKPTAPSATGGRRHTVAAKDSLYAVAKKYYGTATNAKVQAIIEANRDLLPNGAGTPLKEGMILRIP
ncbi:MAG: LysM peptidoglycan-binding domain-containing protein [Undibacterium sp.]|nr:LysM peptidoglycan-binding domain-containing protein [Opitutaceae bacterium]